MLTLQKEHKSKKKGWFKIVVNHHLLKYNILIGYLDENSLLIIRDHS